MKGLKILMFIALTLLTNNFAAAQENEDVIIRRDIEIGPGDPESMMPFEETVPPPGSFVFISSLFEMGDKIIKGAPYSADAVTERIQTLSDGNRIVHKNSSQVYRDSAGRIRREQEFGMIGNWVSAETPERHVFINDPVGGFHYVLEPQNQTARKMRLHDKGEIRFKGQGLSLEEDEDIVLAPASGPAMKEKIRIRTNPANVRKEPLGKQTIEGVEVEGSRNVTVISAGEIGNERAFEMVTEKWYSPELKLYVMTKHSDPRFGETTYRLTNIKRGEPDASLFQVPSNYKIEEGPGPNFKFRKKLD